MLVIVFNSEIDIDPRLALHLEHEETRRLFLNENFNQIQWSSMDTSVVIVNSQGNVTGVSEGLAIVSAIYQGDVYHIYVRVS